MAFGDWFEPQSEREQDILRVRTDQLRENHKHGRMGCEALRADEYRSTFAVIAEYRVLGFAARLSFDDADGLYTLELHYANDWGSRRFSMETTERAKALAWLDRCVAAHPVRAFVCRVDY